MTTITRVPSSPAEFLQFIKQTNKVVYIFGADIAGKIIQKMLHEESVLVSGFLDNNKNKCFTKINDVEVFVANEKLENNFDKIFTFS